MIVSYCRNVTRNRMKAICCPWMGVCLAVMFMCCLPLRTEAVVQTEDLIFTSGPQQMIFTIPTRKPVSEIHTHFVESGEQVILVLPDIEPDLPALEYQRFDDEWIKGYGLKQRNHRYYWQFEKRRQQVPLKKYLSVQAAGRRIVISIMKPYRAVSVGDNSEKVANLSSPGEHKLSESSAKMARINALLAGKESSGNIEKVVAPKSAGLLYPGMRMFASLAALVALILIGYRPVKKMLQKSGNAPDNSLVRILQTIPIGMKRQIMFLDVADEVLVVGLSGDQMTMLTRISDPEKLESLRLLRHSGSAKKSFLSSLRSLSGGDRLISPGADSEPPAGPGNMPAAAEQGDPYGEVVAQIKQRLQGLNRL